MVLASRSYEEYLIALLVNFRVVLERLSINYDCAVMFSLLRADEVRLGVQSNWGVR